MLKRNLSHRRDAFLAAELQEQARICFGACGDKKKYVTKALSLINKSIGLNPYDAISYICKGSILSYMEKYNEALRCLAIAESLRPSRTCLCYIYGDRGEINRSLGEYRDAIVNFNKAFQYVTNRHSPSQIAMLYETKADLLEEMGKLRLAIAVLREGLKRFPQDEFLKHDLKRLLRKKGFPR